MTKFQAHIVSYRYDESARSYRRLVRLKMAKRSKTLIATGWLQEPPETSQTPNNSSVREAASTGSFCGCRQVALPGTRGGCRAAEKSGQTPLVF